MDVGIYICQALNSCGFAGIFDGGWKTKILFDGNPDLAQAMQDPEGSLEETLVVRDAESQGQRGE